MSERRLWSSVLLEAIMDAARHGDNAGYSGNVPVINSLRWFTTSNCRAVCSLAGVDWRSAKRAAHILREEFKTSGKTWRGFREGRHGLTLQSIENASVDKSGRNCPNEDNAALARCEHKPQAQVR